MSEFEIPEEAFKGPEVTGDIAEVNKAKADLDSYMKDQAGKAGTEEYNNNVKQKQAAIQQATTKLLRSVAKAAGIEIPDSDQAIKEFDDILSKTNLTDVNSLKTANDAFNKMSSQYKSVYEASVNKTIRNTSSIADNLSSSGKKANAATQTKAQDAMKKYLEEAGKDNPDPTKLAEYRKTIKECFNESVDTINKEPGLADKITSKLGKYGVKLIASLMALGAIAGAIIGGGYIVLKMIADELTGCYVYFNDGKKADYQKLEGCSDFYSSSVENQPLCTCGALVAPNAQNKGLTNAQCSGIPSECDQPYCIGRCTEPTADKQMCSGFPNAYNLQCTNVGIGDSGYIYYAFQLHTPGSVLGDGLKAIGDFPGDFMKWFTDNIKGILMWIGIAFGVLIGGAIIFRVVMNLLSNSK